ncbi:hypothetical protein ACFQ6S_28245 [Streptomyces sp. NPDC056479]|uniref:hypothetical protein n=1 Tax=Streptomyces sp. NPDC056479 TaxID=3345832 RepID=UPI0036A120FF
MIAGGPKGERIDEIDITTDYDEVGRAVDELNRAVEEYNEAFLDRDRHPYSGRIDAAAKELRDVCAS